MLDLETRIEGPMVVIGDVHGQLQQLARLLRKIRGLRVYEDGWIVFVGDFVDRGPESYEVLDTILRLIDEHPKTTAVMGNHELAMIGALSLIETPLDCHWGRRWCECYSAEVTFDCYGVGRGDLAALRKALPDRHKDLIVNLPWCVEHPDYLIVHGGLLPDMPFEDQMEVLKERDFSLHAPPWLCDHDLAEFDGPPDCQVAVVSGHVPITRAVVREKRILLDTTGGYGGELSAVLLPEREIITSA
jgi:serine/threonine protein phosphatase 1